MARGFSGGNGDQISCSVPTFPTTAYTVSIWINPTSFPNAYNTAFQTNDTPGSANQQIFVKSTGKAAWYAGLTGGSNGVNGFVDPGTISITTGTWQNLCLTFGSTNGGNGYVNGTLDGGFPINFAGGSMVAYTHSNPLFIGADQFNAGRIFSGSIADVAYWNVELSTAEVTALSQGARPSTVRPASLLAFYPLTGIQSPEPDLNGAGHTGTITGTTNAFGPPLMPLTPRWHRYNGLMVPAAGLSWIVNRRNKLGRKNADSGG